MPLWSCPTMPLLTPPGERLLALPSWLGVSPAVLSKLKELAELTELPLFCFEADTGFLAWQSDPELLPCCPMSQRMRLCDVSNPEIVGCPDGLAYFYFPLPQSPDETPYVVGGYCLTKSGAHPRELVLESIAANWELSRLESMLDRLPVCPERMLCKLLPLAVERVRQRSETERLEFDNVNLMRQIEARNVEAALLHSRHEELLLSFVRLLVSTLDAKDPYTRGHSERVALIARKLGQQLQLPNSDLDDIYLAGLLHDLGKIGVDDRVLRKPDQLTTEEFQHIQQHPLIGFQILSQLKSLAHILPGVRSHHESMNGKGYPDRLRGDEIPLMARIIAVADAYDAMRSDRPYRKGMPVEKLEDIFRRGSGEQWDPRVIDAYFQVRDEIVRMCDNYSPTAGNLLCECPGDRSAGITVRSI